MNSRKNNGRSPQQVGQDNAIRLAKWAEVTPIQDMPLNQFGRVAKEPICKLLNISPSTVGSNARLQKIFSDLNDRLRPLVRARRPRVKDGKAASALLDEALRLNCQTTAELQKTQQKLSRLSYLENSGVLVREPTS